MIVHGTPEWYEARRGLITASRASCVVSRYKGELSQAAKKYARELAIERVTGSITQHHMTADMQRGVDLEPEAIKSFEAETGRVVNPGGLSVRRIYMPKQPELSVRIGATPDGWMENHELLEVKCPRHDNQVSILVDGVPSEYAWQMQVQMLIWGAELCHFYSYSPPLKPIWIEVPADQKMQEEFTEKAYEIEQEVGKLIERVRQ